MINPFNNSQEFLSNNRMQRQTHTQTHTKNGGWGTGRTAALGDKLGKRAGAGSDKKEISSGSGWSRKIYSFLFGLTRWNSKTLSVAVFLALHRWHGETKSKYSMSNTRSEVNLEAPEKRRGEGLDDELWRIDMLGQTGRDLENEDKRKIQQEDKPRLNNDGTQTEERRRQEWSSVCEGVWPQPNESGMCGKTRNSGRRRQRCCTCSTDGYNTRSMVREGKKQPECLQLVSRAGLHNTHCTRFYLQIRCFRLTHCFKLENLNWNTDDSYY